RNILITGGAGNVGSSLASRLVQDKDNYVIIVDDLSTGSVKKLPSKEFTNWRFIKADANLFEELAPVMLHYGFDFVFHYAAVVGVQRTLANPIKVLQDVDGIKNVLKLCKNTGVKRVFFSSSSEVYGEPFEIPQREETTPLNSRLPYAIVKNIGEAYLKSFHQEYGLEYTIFRFFNTYGPNQSTDFVISKFVQAALNGQDITIYGDGMQTRTFCYIDDNIEVAEKCMLNDLCVNETINVGNDEEMTIVELAAKIIEINNSSSKLVYLPPLPEGDMKRRCPDITKMKSILNRPLTSLKEGVLKTAANYK
ncbi:MAG: NAD-dependent epimerase/dehydratase family protein, partial [Chitinophagaceae bacterium]|nr:NAD-dependent epimerase/dehydratase family protein [Chitinophagaceae bacterium]